MRNDAKVTKTADIATVQGYHAGGYYGGSAESYAFMGFKELRFYASDRWQKLATDADGCAVRADGKSLKGYGIEIETECNSISDSTVLANVYQYIVFPHFSDGLFKMQRDGSLGGASSAEVITQIMTKEFIRNNYSNFKLMYDTYFPAFGISASASGNCGMHVNISTGCFGEKPERIEDAVKKLLYFVNAHYDFCVRLFYRNPAHTMYCSRMNQYATKDGAKNANLRRMPSSHGNCMNYSHFDAGRIEIRLVGGQKNFPCFRNTMECVFHLVDAMKRVKWEDLDNFAKVFSGCNQYVFDRLATYCKDAGTIDAATVEAIRPTVKRANYI